MIDALAICVSIVDCWLPPDAGEDSFSLLPLSTDEPHDFRRTPPDSPFGLRHVRHSAATMKLVPGSRSGGREQPSGNPYVPPFASFSLEADLARSNESSRVAS
jgi:hypothetical protein